jgi:hypothetical protein
LGGGSGTVHGNPLAAGMTWNNGVPKVVPLRAIRHDLLRGLLPHDDAEAKWALGERRATACLCFQGF